MDIYGRWRVELRSGTTPLEVPLVYGDGKYPTDPPRVASELEAALAEQLEGAVDALREAATILTGTPDDGAAIAMAQEVVLSALDGLGGR